MKRRTAIKIVALSALTAKLDALEASGFSIGWSASDYKLRFFTLEEGELLDQLMEMIIPSDSHSSGAHAAQVNLFADLMVATSSIAVQNHWRQGLKQIQEEAAKSSLAEALAKSAANEGHPATDLERFFAALKQMTVNGYYTSAIGIHKDLQYQGNTYLTAFPSCPSETDHDQIGSETTAQHAQGCALPPHSRHGWRRIFQTAGVGRSESDRGGGT
jgi:gluconate 2-dehydrogenase subunit 3-like protein